MMTADEIREVMHQHITEIMSTRANHIEQFACAFLTQVGVDGALNYELVEQQNEWASGKRSETVWFFRKRS